jgi:Uma2 family endonuclease
MAPVITPPMPVVEPLYPPVAELAYPISFPKNLPSEDNRLMDSPWHRGQMELLINVLPTAWKERDFYCGGNMCIHFSEEQLRNQQFLGPDFFVVLNVDPNRLRSYWATWEEKGRYPDFIVELISPTTARQHLTTKKNLYEKTFRTAEYFCYDPDGFQLSGWRLREDYQPIPVENQRMWSEKLEMWLGNWTGTWDGQETTWLRFFDRDGNLLPTGEEKEAAHAEAEAARADQEAARAKLEAARAEQEAARATSATARADKEAAIAANASAARAAAEEEADRLRKELEALRAQMKKPSQP